MPLGRHPLDLRPSRWMARLRLEMALSPNLRFGHDVLRLIWRYKYYSLAIIGITVLQELAALWPVSLLGQFVDRLTSGQIGNIVWLMMGASALHPLIVRSNVMLRHKVFYETEYDVRAEIVIDEAERGDCCDIESASASHTRAINAVSGITNAAYHILGSFAPVIIKITVVSGNLLAYNRTLGMAYLASLIVPAFLTVVFNDKLRVLRDAQYSVISRVSGAGVRTIAEGKSPETRSRFLQILRERSDVQIALVNKDQIFLYLREFTLVLSQFMIIFMALGMRERIGLTPGDFTRIVGYMAQVAVAFINTAAVLDAIISYSRAYHVYDQGHRPPLVAPPKS